MYNPGFEPESIAKKVKSFFKRIDEFYPDKIVEGLHNSHKKLGERLTSLYRELGYSSGKEMMTAYGYTYIHKKRAGLDKDDLKSELIHRLSERYPNGSGFTTIKGLKDTNPDIASQITSSQVKKEELIEAGILISLSDKYEQLCRFLSGMILEKFPDGPDWTKQSGLIAAIPEAEQYITKIRVLKSQVAGGSFADEMEKHGIFSSKGKNEGAVAPKPQGDNVAGYFQRMYLLDAIDRQFNSITKTSFGEACSDYKKLRERTAPWGNIGNAMENLKKYITKIENIADGYNRIVYTSLQNMEKDLAEISDILGYQSVTELLVAYGYIVI